MYNDPRDYAGEGAPGTVQIYALLRRLIADVRRMDALLRSMKKTMEEKEKNE